MATPCTGRARPDATSLPRLTLVLGGARSGKSRLCRDAASSARCRRRALYLATAEAGDAEMAERIAPRTARGAAPAGDGRRRRSACATALGATRRPEQPILVDCLTLWLVQSDARRPRHRRGDASAARRRCASSPGRSCSSPTRSGSASSRTTRSARAFRDHAGRLNQRSPRSPTASSSSRPACRS